MMGKVSKISYVDASWSPWIGCTPQSPGCLNCYAEAWAKRIGRDFSTMTRASHATFYAPIRWKERKRIFVCELSDFMHRGADDWRPMACGVMAAAPWHDYFILSKRPWRYDDWYADDIWCNWWLGVTAENQHHFDARAEQLLTLPHSRNWLSLEPLLGPIDMSWVLRRAQPTGREPPFTQVRFVVVGAESGPNRRDCKVEWIEDIVDQCKTADVPVFVKQGSHLYPSRQGDIPDNLWAIKEIPE